jgi:hypothetical protein
VGEAWAGRDWGKRDGEARQRLASRVVLRLTLRALALPFLRVRGWAASTHPAL